MRSCGVLFRILTIIAVMATCHAVPTTTSAGELYRLNESTGMLTVIGRGRPPIAVQHPAQVRLLAERAAIVDAYGTATRLLAEAIPQAVSGQDDYSVFLRGGIVKRSEVASDGSVKVELEIPMSPGLAGRVKEVMRGRELLGGQVAEKAGISHEQFVTRHRVQGPRIITRREWIERYQAGAWMPYNR